MAAHTKNIFTYRPLSPESNQSLVNLQESYSEVTSFVPVSKLHISLLYGDSSQSIQQDARKKIITSGPPTINESYFMEITDARIHYGYSSIGRFAIALLLDGTNGHYGIEHRSFSKMAAKKIEPF